MKKYRLVHKYGPVISAAVMATMAASSPAHAAVDWVNGGTQIATALLTLFGVFVIVAAGYRGVEAALDHRSIVNALIGLVFGICLTFGGAYALTTMGAATGSVGTLL